MTLFSVDKNNSDRSSASPNSSDKITGNRMAHQTASSHYQPPEETSTARLQQIGKTIISNDGTTNKATFGYNSALDSWGLFVAKDGVDVMNNTDPNELIFNSNQNVLKIKDTIYGSVPDTGFSVTNTGWFSDLKVVLQIDHGLDYIPEIQASADLTAVGGFIPFPLHISGIIPSGTFSGSPYWFDTYVASNAEHINVITTFMFYNMSAVVDQGITLTGYDVKIRIMQETAN